MAKATEPMFAGARPTPERSESSTKGENVDYPPTVVHRYYGIGCTTGGTGLQRRGFVHGAMLLAGAAMISKLFGSVYTVVLQNIIGDNGMGLFQMAYPIYATLLSVATAGFPVAISKLVSERLAVGDVEGARKVFRVAMLLLTFCGIACFCVLFFGAPMWAEIAGDPAARFAIQAIAPALLIVPVMSALRGYFQGYQWMEPTAASQVVEQLVRVATIIGLAIWLEQAGYGEAMAAAGAAFGAVTGAAAGFVLLFYFWKRPHPNVEVKRPSDAWNAGQVTKRLLYYALPISLGALVVPLMNNVDVVTVVNLLKHAGQSQQQATTDFGLLTGRAFKLMMFPTTLASGIGIAIMPAVSEAFTLGFRRLMSERIDMAIRLTILLSLPAAVGLTLLAGPVDIALFKDASGTATIQVMAIATVFASLQTTIAAVLQGSGWVYLPVFNLLIASAVKLVGNLLLVPMFGIRGAAGATVISYLVATILNLISMWRCIDEPVRWRSWVIKPSVATFIMSAAVFAAERQWMSMGGLEWSRALVALACCVICGIGIVVYSVALLAAGGLSAKELESVPRFGPQLVVWCSRIGLLR